MNFETFELTRQERTRALVVEAEHANGRRCDECGGGMRGCRRLNVWWSAIVLLRAQRACWEREALTAQELGQSVVGRHRG
jgi:hypothetical protein